ncbi:hypothetical protein EK21DRAFT_89544 [Setomelanomma holmii]|uniref:Mannosyl-3-phosphoglycerate synthase n=1 Tax=Setomelanomma holmii TaxID=210430 RepID=A0A9P4LMJ7_9PLEO|nr:hypothetical protein EK21DRAFT_89544 [Setomelanomma holmii]
MKPAALLPLALLFHAYSRCNSTRQGVNSGSARIGNVEVHKTSKVIELDAGHIGETSDCSEPIDKDSTFAISQDFLHDIEKDLAIVIPCMDEDLSVLDGVLEGVPHDSLIIIISNSAEANFQEECQFLEEYCNSTQRAAIVVHQQNPRLAWAFENAGMSALVEHDADTHTPHVRHGKGEAMMIGTTLAHLSNKSFVGFIDADNFVAGSVLEYCKAYAAGIHYARHCTDSDDPYAMIRIKWNSKPKVRDNELVFEKSGRSSRVVNHWMNRLFSYLISTAHSDGAGRQDIIQTANAGEHAMSTALALRILFTSGYAVEPYQLIALWSYFNTSSHTVQVLQIETRNPHFHDCSKGDGNIQRMQAGGLGTIYHSELTPPGLRDGWLAGVTVYPPLSDMDFDVFRKSVKGGGGTMKMFGIEWAEDGKVKAKAKEDFERLWIVME